MLATTVVITIVLLAVASIAFLTIAAPLLTGFALTTTLVVVALFTLAGTLFLGSIRSIRESGRLLLFRPFRRSRFLLRGILLLQWSLLIGRKSLFKSFFLLRLSFLLGSCLRIFALRRFFCLGLRPGSGAGSPWFGLVLGGSVALLRVGRFSLGLFLLFGSLGFCRLSRLGLLLSFGIGRSFFGFLPACPTALGLFIRRRSLSNRRLYLSRIGGRSRCGRPLLLVGGLRRTTTRSTCRLFFLGRRLFDYFCITHAFWTFSQSLRNASRPRSVNGC